jgi:hypothetical protein
MRTNQRISKSLELTITLIDGLGKDNNFLKALSQGSNRSYERRWTKDTRKEAGHIEIKRIYR